MENKDLNEFVFLGNVLIDVYVNINEEFMKENEILPNTMKVVDFYKYNFLEKLINFDKELLVGGSTFNTLRLFNFLKDIFKDSNLCYKDNKLVTCIGAVSNDYYGTKIIDKLNSEKLNMKIEIFPIETYKKSSGVCCVLISDKNDNTIDSKDRALITDIGISCFNSIDFISKILSENKFIKSFFIESSYIFTNRTDFISQLLNEIHFNSKSSNPLKITNLYITEKFKENKVETAYIELILFSNIIFGSLTEYKFLKDLIKDILSNEIDINSNISKENIKIDEYLNIKYKNRVENSNNYDDDFKDISYLLQEINELLMLFFKNKITNEIESTLKLKASLFCSFRIFVLTDGSKNSYCFVYEDFKIIDLACKAPRKVNSNNIIDTNGCGDSFAAGFLFQYFSNFNISDSLLLGNICGENNLYVKGFNIPEKNKFLSFFYEYDSKL